MSAYRNWLIKGVNLLVFAWLLKVMLFDQNSDAAGLFVVAGLLVMAIFTAYALVLAALFKDRQGVQVELLFSGLLLVPWVILCRLLS